MTLGLQRKEQEVAPPVHCRAGRLSLKEMGKVPPAKLGIGRRAELLIGGSNTLNMGQNVVHWQKRA